MATKPGELKTVQARILHYALEIGWTYVPRAETEWRWVLNLAWPTPEKLASTHPALRAVCT